jgi:hypothetical protein
LQCGGFVSFDGLREEADVRGIWLIVAVALVLWAGCAATPGDPIGKGWPDVTCHGGNARAMLDDIIAKATEDGRTDDVVPAATQCRDNHTGVTVYHCAKVTAAWALAQQAAAETDSGKKKELWDACLDELTHPPD